MALVLTLIHAHSCVFDGKHASHSPLFHPSQRAQDYLDALLPTNFRFFTPDEILAEIDGLATSLACLPVQETKLNGNGWLE